MVTILALLSGVAAAQDATFIAQDCQPGLRYENGSVHCPESVWGGGRA